MNMNNIKWLVIYDVITHHIPSSTRMKRDQQERVLDFSKTIRDFETFFFLNKSTLEGLRRYYLIDSPVPIVVQNGRTHYESRLLSPTIRALLNRLGNCAVVL